MVWVARVAWHDTMQIGISHVRSLTGNLPPALEDAVLTALVLSADAVC